MFMSLRLHTPSASENSNNTFISKWWRYCENQISHYLIFVRHLSAAVAMSKVEKYKTKLVCLSFERSVVKVRHWAFQGGRKKIWKNDFFNQHSSF